MLHKDEAPVKGAIVTGAGRGIGRAAALIISSSYFPFDRFQVVC
jgi:short-subunit dehydrogenase